MKKLLPLVLVLLTINTYAQDLNFERYLISGNEQSSLIMKDYLNPVMVGMMNASASSWYSTAETHKRFGFDLTFNATIAMIPDSDKSFDASKYTNIIFSGDATSMPTIVGSSDETPSMTASFIHEGQRLRFDPANPLNAPNGIGLSTAFAPMPMIQAGLGIGWGTEIKFRFVPNSGTNNFEAGMWGIALQHDIFQYIPFEGKIPVHLSVLGGYTSSNATWTFKTDDSQWDGSNQHTDFKVETYSFQLLASTNIPIINAYAGVGYNSSKATYDMKGDYLIDYLDDNNNTVTVTYTNPAAESWKSTGFNATFGARLSLGFFKLFADYTFKEYNTATVGFAFSFR
jgi:hypothetical protein